MENIDQLKKDTLENRNKIKRCPCCNSNIKDRTVSLYKEFIISLYKVYCFCGQAKKHEFNIEEVKGMMSKSDYARFGDFIRFGGLVYRPKVNGRAKKGHYGLNMARCHEFYTGTRTIPVQIVLNQITNEIISQTDCHYHEFPTLLNYMKEVGFYDYEKQVRSYPTIPEKPKKKTPIIDYKTGTVRFN